MLDVFDVANVLIDHVKQAYPEEIAIIAYYGSYAQGTATARSDLDFFFIPATAKGYGASLQFIIDGISFDFWPIDWERAGRMASFEESKTAIIADCKLLYARSDGDRDRFMKLREGVTAMQSPEHAGRLAQKAEDELRNAYVHLYKMSRAAEPGELAFYRMEVGHVLVAVLQALALINGTYYTRGFGKNKDQLLRLPVRPASLEPLMAAIMHSSLTGTILQACEQLTAETLELVLARKERYYESPSYPDRMKGCYEEVKGVLDKIITACESDDYDTAFFAALQAQDNIACCLFFAETGGWPSDLMSYAACHGPYKLMGLPDLAEALHAEDLSLLQAAVENLSTHLESQLRLRGVHINRFDNIGQFKAFLQEKNRL